METERKKKKWLALVLIVVIAAVAVSIVLYALRHPQLDMDFDPMRSQTNEENQNNAENKAYMAADENYVCFQDKEYGLVCYDIRKDQYTVLELDRRSIEHSMQIEDGYLYYNRLNTVWRINLENKRKEKIQGADDTRLSFPSELKVYHGDVFWFNSVAGDTIKRASGHNVTEIGEVSVLVSFVIANGYLYYNDSYDHWYEETDNWKSYLDIIKQNLDDSEDKVVIPSSKVSANDDVKFFLRGDSVYLVMSFDEGEEVYEIKDDQMIKVADVYARRGKMVFYGDYIVTDGGIYSSDWKELARFDFVDLADPFAQFIPMVVGGNLYFYSSEELDWPAVGRGYYKLDIEEYLKQNAA